jgi:hypothetical protein
MSTLRPAESAINYHAERDDYIKADGSVKSDHAERDWSIKAGRRVAPIIVTRTAELT